MTSPARTVILFGAPSLLLTLWQYWRSAAVCHDGSGWSTVLWGLQLLAFGLSLVAVRFQTPGAGTFPLIQLPFFVLYQLPFLAAFWLTREGPDRKGVGLAMTFSAVSAMYGLWSGGTLLFYYVRVGGLHPSQLIPLADIVATGAAAFFAFSLWRRGPETSNDMTILLGGILGSILYLGMVRFVFQFLVLRGLGG